MAQNDAVEYDAEKVRQIYAETYASFLALPGFSSERKFLRHRLQLILGLARLKTPANGRYMDLGSGLGIKTRIVAEFFKTAVGLDYVERCVQICNLLNDLPGLKFVQADATKPFGEQFDFVTAFGLSVFNVHDPGVCAMSIQEAVRNYVKPGGVMMVYSFTDFSGKAPSGWVNHRKPDLDMILKGLNANGMKARIIFPHKHLKNYIGNGPRHLVGELVKLVSRKRRDYYIVIETLNAAHG